MAGLACALLDMLEYLGCDGFDSLSHCMSGDYSDGDQMHDEATTTKGSCSGLAGMDGALHDMLGFDSLSHCMSGDYTDGDQKHDETTTKGSCSGLACLACALQSIDSVGESGLNLCELDGVVHCMCGDRSNSKFGCSDSSDIVTVDDAGGRETLFSSDCDCEETNYRPSWSSDVYSNQ